MSQKDFDRKFQADSKRALDRDQKLQETGSSFNLKDPHKGWYNIQGMGKQLGKPHATPPETKKTPKDK